MEKYLWPQISAVSADAEGIVFESYGSLPGVGLVISPLGSALPIAVLMPGLGRARHLAKRAGSMANLNGIGKALAIYANDGTNDKYPSDLAALVKAKYLPLKILVSPLSGRRPPRLVNGKLVGQIDYIYVGYPEATELPGDAILVYERLENHRGEGTMVLDNNFSVSWMDMATFEKALKRTQ